jgi:hypothetical protein
MEGKIMAIDYGVLKAAILAETDGEFVALRNSGATGAMANWYNTPSDPAFYVWKTSASTDDIYDAVDWQKLTPTDSPDDTQTYTNRALVCQAKQINLQIMLQGQSRINAAKLKIRQGLTDALQNVPSGTAGAMLDAGWLSVKNTLYRQATRGEKIYATGTGTVGVPGLAVFEGSIRNEDIVLALSA